MSAIIQTVHPERLNLGQWCCNHFWKSSFKMFFHLNLGNCVYCLYFYILFVNQNSTSNKHKMRCRQLLPLSSSIDSTGSSENVVEYTSDRWRAIGGHCTWNSSRNRWCSSVFLNQNEETHLSYLKWSPRKIWWDRKTP